MNWIRRPGVFARILIVSITLVIVGLLFKALPTIQIPKPSTSWSNPVPRVDDQPRSNSGSIIIYDGSTNNNNTNQFPYPQPNQDYQPADSYPAPQTDSWDSGADSSSGGDWSSGGGDSWDNSSGGDSWSSGADDSSGWESAPSESPDDGGGW